MLCDTEIIELCTLKNMVSPFNYLNVNPASLDILMGDMILVEDAVGWLPVDISRTDINNAYQLKPGQFILGQSLEVFCIPEDIAAQFCLKSSRAREGYEHSLAGFIDPGWSNSVLTLELRNNSSFVSLPVYYKMPIGQIVFFRMDKIPNVSYKQKGNYNGDGKVTPSVFDPRKNFRS